MRIAAVILAGGKGSRMGGADKALLTLRGETLLERAIRATAGCDIVVVSRGQDAAPVPFGVAVVRDLPCDYAGPLAGVAAAVAHLGGQGFEALLSLAVDTPWFPADFLTRALPRLETAAAVVSAYEGQIYPTNGLWRMDAIGTLPDRVMDGTAPRSLKAIAGELSAVRLDYAEWSPHDPFRNANTPEELAFLASRDGTPR